MLTKTVKLNPLSTHSKETSFAMPWRMSGKRLNVQTLSIMQLLKKQMVFILLRIFFYPSDKIDGLFFSPSDEIDGLSKLLKADSFF